jgi:hypothetical protein
MSSIPTFDAARWEAVGIRDQIPRRRLKKNIVLWSVRFAFWEGGTGARGENVQHNHSHGE